MGKIHKIIVLACFFFLGIIYLDVPEKPSHNFQLTVFITVLISTISLYRYQKLGFGNFRYFSITPLFVLGYLIVFFQIPLLDFFGFQIQESLFNFIWVDESVVNKSIFISAVGLLSFYLGIMYFRKLPTKEMESRKIKSVRKSGTFLIWMSYALYILFFLSAGSYRTGEYTPENASFLVTYFGKFFNVFLTAAIILRVSELTALPTQSISFKKYLSYFNKYLLFLLFWHLGFSLFVGDRGPILYYGLMAFSLYFLRFKQFGIVKVAVILFFASIFFTAVGIVRQTRGGDQGYVERVLGLFESKEQQNSKGFDTSVPGGSTIELAFSVRTLNHIVYNVPRNYEHGYGTFQSTYVYSIVPGLNGLMLKILHDGDSKYDGSSSFVTYLIQGNDPQYGDGSSVVADFYLDFGLPGIIIGLFLFGMFVGKNEYKLFFGYQQISIAWIALLIYFSLAIYLNRSALLLQLSKIVLVYIALRVDRYIPRSTG